MPNGFHSDDPFSPPTMEALDDPVCFMPGCDRPNPKWESGLAWIVQAIIDEPKEAQGGLVLMPSMVRFCSRQCADRWHQIEDKHAFDNDRKYGMHPELHSKFVPQMTPGEQFKFSYNRHDADNTLAGFQPPDYGGLVEYEFDYPGHPRQDPPSTRDTPMDVLLAGVKPHHNPTFPNDGSHWPSLPVRRHHEHQPRP